MATRAGAPALGGARLESQRTGPEIELAALQGEYLALNRPPKCVCDGDRHLEIGGKMPPNLLILLPLEEPLRSAAFPKLANHWRARRGPENQLSCSAEANLSRPPRTECGRRVAAHADPEPPLLYGVAGSRRIVASGRGR